MHGVQPNAGLLSGMGVTDAEIWLACKDDLTRYAAALVGPTDAEDVVSTVVVRVLDRRSLGDLDEARGYLFRAVLNECKTRGARRDRASQLVDRPLDPPADPMPEVLDAVISLPLRQRSATFLVYWADLSIAETARLMGVRTGAVKRYIHLARSKLRGVLSEHAFID